MDLDDSGRLDPRPQDVLLCRLVVFGTQPLQVVQEAVVNREVLDSIYGALVQILMLLSCTTNFPPFDFRTLMHFWRRGGDLRVLT